MCKVLIYAELSAFYDDMNYTTIGNHIQTSLLLTPTAVARVRRLAVSVILCLCVCLSVSPHDGFQICSICWKKSFSSVGENSSPKEAANLV